MAAVQLQKGGNVSISRVFSGATKVWVALKWSPRQVADMDIDASAFVLAADGRVRGDEDLVFYNNPASSEGAVTLLADASPAAADAAQVFAVDFAVTPAEVQRIAFTVTIHQGHLKGQRFGLLESAWVRVLEPPATERIRFELPLADSQETALIFCELYRHREEWKFRAVGQGYVGGLEPLARGFGVDVADSDETPASAGAEPASIGSDPSAIEKPSPSNSEPATEITTEASHVTPAVESAAVLSPEPTTEMAQTPQTRSAAETDPAPSAAASAQRQERLAMLMLRDSELADVAKQVGKVLETHGLQSHRAQVALCLDISGSMQGLYRRGSIDSLVRKLLGLALHFDDAGAVEVFLFGNNAHHAGQVTADNYRRFVTELQKRFPLEAGTAYGKVMALLREHYRHKADADRLPVYVLFATDGDTSDRPDSEQQIKDAAGDAIFWQFMAIGIPPEEKKGFFSRLLSPDFKFLAYLDTMPDRVIDNANFFLVRDPAEPSAGQLLELMMVEYPLWLNEARAKGLLA